MLLNAEVQMLAEYDDDELGELDDNDPRLEALGVDRADLDAAMKDFVKSQRKQQRDQVSIHSLAILCVGA